MIYSSDGSVYDSEMHHQLDEPQEEKTPVRVAGKKSYEPPPIKKPPTLPPLEPLTDPGNPPRGQYGPPGIEYPPWTVERPFAMNDNTPPLPLDITMPNIQGGLRKPPKPANDNDPRKPYGVDDIGNLLTYDQLVNWFKIAPGVDPATDFQRKGIPLPKTGDLNVEPSHNIVTRPKSDLPTTSKEIEDMAFESAYDKKVARQRLLDYGKEEKDTLGIGLEDWQHLIDLGIAKSEYRRLFKEQQMKKNIIKPSKRTEK